MKPVLVLTTIPAGFDASALSYALVEMRLAACVNILDRVCSVYRWEERVAEDDEQLLIIKSADDRISALREELLRRHPYALPEFVVVPISETSEAYGAWLLEAL